MNFNIRGIKKNIFPSKIKINQFYKICKKYMFYNKIINIQLK